MMIKKKNTQTENRLWKREYVWPSAELVNLLLDPTLLVRFPTIDAWCEAEKIPLTDKDRHSLRGALEADIAKQISRLGAIMYRYFQVSQSWPIDNEQSVRLAYARHLLALPPDKEVSYEDSMTCQNMLQERYASEDIQGYSESALKQAHKSFQFALFGRSLILEKQPLLNQALTFLGSDQRIYFDNYGIGVAAIFGKTLIKTIGPYTVYFIKHETSRTPNYVMSNPALHAEHQIALRDESLRAIFYMKWMPVLANPNNAFLKHTIAQDVFWNVSQGIKEKVLQLYDAADVATMQEKEAEFLRDMRETILYHEMGHGLTTEHLLPVENVAIGQSPEIYGVWFYDALLEFLADFAPTQNNLHGAMQNIVKTAQKNVVRAERMFYIYLSDIWFYDTDDAFMLPYADFMALVLSRYIRRDHHIDFELMAKDLDYQKNRTDKKQLSLYERVYELFMWDTDEMAHYVKKATFKLTEEENFAYVYKLRLQSAKKQYPNIDPNSDTFLVPFWQNMFHYLRVFSDAKPLESYIQTQIAKNMKKMFILAAGRSVAESYQYDHRRYIEDTYRKLKLTSRLIPFEGKNPQ